MQQRSLIFRPVQILSDDQLRIIHDPTIMDSIYDDMKDISDLIKDFDELIHQQQEHLDIIDNNISDTNIYIHEAEKQIIMAKEHQSSINHIKTIGFITIGTIIGASVGGLGIFIGLKPIAVTIIGSSVGLVVSFLK